MDQLCKKCRELDLASLRDHEKNETAIGSLANFSDELCPFCKLISRAMHLSWDSEEDVSPKSLKLFLQSKSPVSVKQGGHKIYPQPRLILATDRKPANFKLNRAFNRGIDRTTNRFIIAEIEFLPDTGLSDNSSAQFFTRCEVGTEIDSSVLKSWVDECHGHVHSMNAKKNESLKLFEHKDGFRLIDVVDGNLVNKKERCEYVALSYVWGQITPFKTLKSNYEHLCAPGSLSPNILIPEVGTPIPETILDAIKFTRQIGIRYIWVDAICIVQDDSDELARLIGQMDNVYDNAALTIIAASGLDAQAGLPGITPRQSNQFGAIRAVDKPTNTTLNLAISYPTLSEQVRKSQWNTRGWTFQESCLSQRCLYFTPDEVFFNCSQEQYRERYKKENVETPYSHLELRTGPPWWSRSLRKDPDATPYHYMGGHDNNLDFMTYQTAVQDYSRKQLTKAKDVLNAFTGIFNRFNRPSEEFGLSPTQVQGIPLHLLYLGLLWFPSEEAKPRSPKITQQAREDKETTPIHLASWSWASWLGAIEYTFTDNDWLTRIIAYAVRDNKPIHPAVAYWNFADTHQRFWSHPAWDPDTPGEHVATRKHLLNIGIEADKLLGSGTTETDVVLDEKGALGFWAAYVSAGEFKGKYRLDDGADGKVSRFALMVAGDAINKGETFMMFLGLVAQDDGTYRRAGVGFLRNVQSLEGVWEYSYFVVR